MGLQYRVLSITCARPVCFAGFACTIVEVGK